MAPQMSLVLLCSVCLLIQHAVAGHLLRRDDWADEFDPLTTLTMNASDVALHSSARQVAAVSHCGYTPRVSGTWKKENGVLIFKTSSCASPPPRVDLTRLRKRLQGHTVYFIGNSIARALLFDLRNMLTRAPVGTRAAQQVLCPKHPRYAGDAQSCSLSLGRGITGKYIWMQRLEKHPASGADFCHGAAPYECLQSMFADSKDGDVVIMTTGFMYAFHWAKLMRDGASKEVLQQGKERIKSLVDTFLDDALKRVFKGKMPDVIFTSMTPFVREIDENKRPLRTLNEAVRHVSRIMEHEFKRQGCKVMDFFTMNSQRLFAYADNVHWPALSRNAWRFLAAML